MRIILLITAPIIYFLIIGFSLWLAWLISSNRRRTNLGPLAAFAAGWVTCAFSALLIQIGQLEIPAVAATLPLICLTGGVGIFLGVIYLWIAKFVLDSLITASLYILGSVTGSSISLYFYFFHSQVQDILISTAWGFLLGVLLYIVFLGQDGSGGIQGAFREIVNRTRR